MRMHLVGADLRESKQRRQGGSSQFASPPHAGEGDGVTTQVLHPHPQAHAVPLGITW